MIDRNLPYKRSVTGLLLILMSTFFLMFIVVGLLQPVLKGSGLSEHNCLLLSSALQAVFVFAVPSIITAYFESKNPLAVVDLNVKPTSLNIIGVILIFVLGSIALSQIIYYNEHLALPDSLHNLELKMKELEEAAAGITETLLSGETLMDLLLEVLVIGVITGLSEELFFRAGVQRILGYAIPKHCSIWVTAIFFSLLHMQFYGFIPRMLMGVVFGYFYYWSGSIWVSVIAHALNNSWVVLTVWLERRCGVNIDYSNELIATHGIPWLGILSGLVTIFILYRFNGLFFKKGSTKLSTNYGSNNL